MEDNFGEYLSESKKVVLEYLETRFELAKLQAVGKLSKALGVFFMLTMAFLLFFFVVVFLGMVLGFWIAEWSGSFAVGFSCSAGVFILLLGGVLLFRKRLIQQPLANLLVAVLAEEMDEEEEEIN